MKYKAHNNLVDSEGREPDLEWRGYDLVERYDGVRFIVKDCKYEDDELCVRNASGCTFARASDCTLIAREGYKVRGLSDEEFSAIWCDAQGWVDAQSWPDTIGRDELTEAYTAGYRDNHTTPRPELTDEAIEAEALRLFKNWQLDRISVEEALRSIARFARGHYEGSE